MNRSTWMLWSLRTVALMLPVLAVDAVLAQMPAAKPRVPVGIDPGGLAIGLVTGGIDYTRSDVAACLARDGEGELIGWDVADRDRKPFARNTADSELIATGVCKDGGRAVVVRINTSDAISIGRALAFLSTTPARVAVVPVTSLPADWGLFRAAVAEFKQLLVVVAAERGSVEAVGPDAGPLGLPNVVVVTRGAPTAAAALPDEVVAVDVPVANDVGSLALSRAALAKAVAFLRAGGADILAKSGGAAAKAEFLRRR